MRTSSSIKKQILRAAAATLCFVLLVTAGFAGLLHLYYAQFGDDYDLLFMGASTTYYGVDPVVVDDVLDTNSVNMSSALTSFESRYEMVRYMLEKQPVKQVVLDLSHDALTLDMENWPYEREIPVVLHFADPKDGIAYMTEHTDRFSDYELTFKNAVAAGLDVLIKNLCGQAGDFAAHKGFEASNPEALAGEGITPSERGEYGGIPVDYRQENEDMLTEIVQLCREHEVPVLLVSIPLSENMIWRYNGWDTFHEKAMDLAEKLDCPYYDFSLLKDRQDILSDEYSFKDLSHLSGEGAQAFSRVLAESMRAMEQGEDISEWFYDSYEEAIEHFVYAR